MQVVLWSVPRNVAAEEYGGVAKHRYSDLDVSLWLAR